MGPNFAILPMVTKYLPISPRFTRYEYLSRWKFGSLTARQSMVAFLLTHVHTLSATEEKHKFWLDKNQTNDFRTRRCGGHLLDHSGDEGITRTESNEGRIKSQRVEDN